MDDTARAIKEAFVTGGTGCHPKEILLAISPLLTGCIASHVMRRESMSDLQVLLMEFGLTIVPTIISFTLAEYTLAILVFHSLLIWAFYPDPQKLERTRNSVGWALTQTSTAFFTEFRGAMMMAVCLGILAVDFPAFPRRFMKTETYGISVMDIGVGVMVSAAGMASARFRTTGRTATLLPSVPLLILGFGRLRATQSVNYPAHETEYGRHWNFFFSLAFLHFVTWLTTTVLRWHQRPQWVLGVGIILLFVYETCLRNGAASFIVSPQRDSDLFEANREGIIGLAGYTALFLISWGGMGNAIFAYGEMPADHRGRLRVSLERMTDCLLTVGLLLIANGNASWQLSSRRLVNANYVLWVLFITSLFCGCFMVAQRLGLLARPSLLFECVNREGLSIFLLANVLTGMVNLSLGDTTRVSSPMALAILMVYMGSLALSGYVMKQMDWRIKFW
eukprot:Clim_evm45s153 gene=Clim_evmTU45s153